MKPVILFDGVCNLCNASVAFVIRHDPSAYFKFASLQSEAAQKLLKKSDYPNDIPGSFILIEDEKIFKKSTAALRVAKRLRGMIKLIYLFIIVPAFIRDAVYDFIAKRRYKWFGKRDSCMIPSPEINKRFL